MNEFTTESQRGEAATELRKDFHHEGHEDREDRRRKSLKKL